MKKLLLFVFLLFSALTSQAQTARALADTAFAHVDYKTAYWKYYSMNWRADAEVALRVGVCAAKLGEEFDPAKYFKIAIDLNPNNSEAYYQFGLLYLNYSYQDIKAMHDSATTNSTDLERCKKNYAIDKARIQLYLKKAIELGNADAKRLWTSLNGI